MAPGAFRLIKIKVAQWERETETALKANETLLFDFEQDVDHSRFSMYQMEDMPDPRNSWCLPMVTGHRYRFHWGENLDFTNMDIILSEKWEKEDLTLDLMTNFTDVRASINITTKGEKLWI